LQVVDSHLFKFTPSMDCYVAGHFYIALHILLVLICAVPKDIGLLLNHLLPPLYALRIGLFILSNK
jgi:hypothetical protein